MKVKTAKVIEEHSSDSNNASASEEESVPSEQSEDETRFNSGWADAVSKILKTKKPKGKSLVLGKAKKINEVKKVQEKSAGFEVQTKEGDVKEVKLRSGATTDQEKLPLAKRKKKRELTSLRVKPDILDKDRERMLCKIATRGVVQLFNSVKSQQKDISEKLEQAGPLEVKKDKVMKSIDKRAFLDVLMGEKSKSVSLDEDKNPKNSDKTTWNVLRDDFMMDAKLKNWDKEMEDDEEEKEEEEEEELEREEEMEVE